MTRLIFYERVFMYVPLKHRTIISKEIKLFLQSLESSTPPAHISKDSTNYTKRRKTKKHGREVAIITVLARRRGRR
jgi:hypothetical protein